MPPEEGRDNTLSPEIAARKRQVLQAVEAGRKAYVGYGSDSRGAITGLAVGVKPSLLLAGDRVDPELLAEGLEEAGFGVEIAGELLYRPDLVYLRLAEEPELAEEIGWKTDRPLAENLATASPISADPPTFQARMGFALGFPASAIRNYRRLGELSAGGLPTHPESLMDGLASGDALKSFEIDKLDPEDERAVSRFRERKREFSAYAIGKHARFKRGGRPSRSAFIEALIEEFEPDLARIYRRYFDMNDADIDLVLHQSGIRIANPMGETIFTFKASGKDAENAPDVAALRKKVEEAFKDAGFVPPLAPEGEVG
jgi:hypothetical protein